MSYKWQPSKKAKIEFANKMREIEKFCDEHNISQSSAGDSYYFSIDGVNYRVSNHTVELSNSKAYDAITGEQKRELYHKGGRKEDVVYIHAGKTRIIDIYNDLVVGYKLDGKGNRK